MPTTAAGEQPMYRAFSNHFASAFILSVATSIAIADETAVVDIGNPILMAVVEVSPVNNPEKISGLGFFIDEKGCEILTPYHVAFGVKKQSNGGVALADGRSVGYKVAISAVLDANPGRFQRRISGTVIDLGDYDPGSNMGRAQDMARVKLSECVGPSAKALQLATFGAHGNTPKGPVSELTMQRASDGSLNRRFVIESGCDATSSLAMGQFQTSCRSVPGDSGSPILEIDNGQATIVGMVVAITNSPKATLAISARSMKEFLDDFKPPQDSEPSRR